MGNKRNKDTRRNYLKARKEKFKRKMENLIEEGINTEMSTTEDTCSEISPKEELLKESESTRQFFLDGFLAIWDPAVESMFKPRHDPLYVSFLRFQKQKRKLLKLLLKEPPWN